MREGPKGSALDNGWAHRAGAKGESWGSVLTRGVLATPSPLAYSWVLVCKAGVCECGGGIGTPHLVSWAWWLHFSRLLTPQESPPMVGAAA